MDTATVSKPTAIRGSATREALIDAAEALIADNGFRTPSHRHIAGEAGVHVALINYHFSTKEMLFETAVERRSAKLTQSWRDALALARSRGPLKPEDVLWAWWQPFKGIGASEGEAPWRNYLCVISRLISAPSGDEWHQRYFGAIDREFYHAFAEAAPGVDQLDVEASFRYARTLFGETLLHHCGKGGARIVPRGFRVDDVDRLIRYLAEGLRGLRGAAGGTAH